MLKFYLITLESKHGVDNWLVNEEPTNQDIIKLAKTIYTENELQEFDDVKDAGFSWKPIKVRSLKDILTENILSA